MTSAAALDTPIARQVWETRYRAGAEGSIEATWRRVARALAAVEPIAARQWEQCFLDVLADFQFLPGGRILAGAGTHRDVTLFNCFVMGPIEDSIHGIFRALEEGAITMQRGGGVGYDFSTLRPSGTEAHSTGAVASGPVSFMDVWDAMCATVQSTGARRGAMMATLRCDHPDIVEFIEAKRTGTRLRHFNLSVQVTDAFIQAVDAGADWPLVFPDSRLAPGSETLLQARAGAGASVSCQVMRRIPARTLWNTLLRASYDSGEPGVLFVDRINQANNLRYCEQISATNPCGEVPLPPYGACDLGAINLPRLVRQPFTPQSHLDTGRLAQIVPTAVRLLDNVFDASHFPLPQQQAAVRRDRRIGLGITGLADALIMLGLRYDSDAALAWAGDAMRCIRDAAYRQSIRLAQEKGVFPGFAREPYLEAPFICGLPADIRDGIVRHGIRNSHLLAIAPTGTISLLAGNVSSGMEPVFAADYQRTVLNPAGEREHYALTDFAVRRWRASHDRADGVPNALVTPTALPIQAHLGMQAVLQRYVDNAISKTIAVPGETRFEEFAPVFRAAYDLGLKGCTAFRPTPITGAVLTPAETAPLSPCCRPAGECE